MSRRKTSSEKRFIEARKVIASLWKKGEGIWMPGINSKVFITEFNIHHIKAHSHGLRTKTDTERRAELYKNVRIILEQSFTRTDTNPDKSPYRQFRSEYRAKGGRPILVVIMKRETSEGEKWFLTSLIEENPSLH